MAEKYDCIVVGLGAMGSATLYQLAHQSGDYKLLGIDRFSPPHSHGSSHGGSRVLRLATAEGEVYLPIVKRSHEIISELLSAYGHDIYYPGGLIVADKANAFLLETMRFAQQQQIAYSIYSSEELQEAFPVFDQLTNTQGYFENNMGLLNPEAIIELQCALAIQQGATLHFDESLISLKKNHNGLITCTTDKAEYTTRHLILTAGSWNAQFLPQSYQHYFQIQRATQYYFKVETLYQALYKYQSFFTTLRCIDENNIAILFPDVTQSGTVKLAPWILHDTQKLKNPESVPPISQNEITKVYNTFIEGYFKGITRECISCSTCIYTMLPNDSYIIDYHPEFGQNVIFVSACSGHGFKNSPAIGESLAQQILHGHNDLNLMQLFPAT